MTSDDVAARLLEKLNYLDADDALAAGGMVGPMTFVFELDFDSARVWPDLPYDTASPESHYPPNARPPIQGILDAAASTFRRRAPKAWVFVNDELDNAMIRRSSAVAGASSSSNRELVGTCLLTNLEMAPDSVSVCVEALVHESIHQFLYRLEKAGGSFCDLADAGRYRSPWSGNRIPLHSLIHASLVWFGVLALWCQLAKTVSSDDEASSVQRRVTETLFGFAFIRQTIEGPAFPRSSVAPRILQLIANMGELATAAGPAPYTRGALADFLQSCGRGAWVADLRAGLVRMTSG